MRCFRNGAACALALCALACAGEKSKLGQPGKPFVEPAFGDSPTSTPADLPGLRPGVSAFLNLQNIVHLADITQPGLFMDFGSPARNKYTVGHWKTGWGKDVVEGDTSYTFASGSGARVYFPLNDSDAFTLRLRLRPVGSQALQPILNNQALASVRLDRGPGFAEYDVAVPAGLGRTGENNLFLRFPPRASGESEPIAVAVDFIRVVPVTKPSADGIPQPPPTKYEALPVYNALLQDLVVGGHQRKAITVGAPTTLTFHVEVPKGAQLSFRAGAPDGKTGMASALVRVTAEGGKSRVLWRGLLGADWIERVISLEPYAGSVIKLEFSALGEGVVGFASPSLLEPTSPLTAAKAPAQSVIVLLIDTLRADHLSAYEKTTRVHTPALDDFAAAATVFDAAQAPENWTKPSVASVLTGLYPLSHGTKTGDARLSERAIVLSEAFKDSGFATAAFLANGFVSEKFGFNQGWDDFINYVHEKRNSKAVYVFRDAANWVQAHRDQRFFLYVQTADPHVPYDPPSEYLSLYDKASYSGPIKARFTADQLEKAKVVPPKLVLNERDRQYLEALYDGEISFHDHYLGLFVDRLKQLGVYDRVMFVVTADHGEEFYDHGSYGHGHSVYQELLHVPLLVRLPGQSQPQHVTETVSTIDIAPSVLAGAGVPVPEEMEGTDRLPQLLGANAVLPAVAFSDFLDDRHAIRAGRWKLILRALTPTLFDLKSDPHEAHELDPRAHPIAMRYCRMLLGQFLGTRDRGDWLNAEPKGRSVELKGGAADIDESTRAGLRALGYAN